MDTYRQSFDKLLIPEELCSHGAVRLILQAWAGNVLGNTCFLPIKSCKLMVDGKP